PGMNRVAALAYAPLVVLVYVKNLMWPWRLSFYYPIEWVWEWTAWKALALILLPAAALVIWYRLRDRSEVRLLVLWTAALFLTPVMAVSTFVREDWVHDRH